jgi:Phytanoyl-CoA dioxygenase (PhyH)
MCVCVSSDWLAEEKMVGLMDRQQLARGEEVVRGLLEHANLYKMSGRLLDGATVTLPFKWLRGVKRGQFTGVHADRVYFHGIRYPMLTSWIPLGAVPTELGGLAVLPTTHRCASFAGLRRGYGQSQVGMDGLQSGWELELTGDPRLAGSAYGVHWHTTDFRPGDVVFFGPWLFHMSTTNTTDRLRLSCDCRWIRRPSLRRSQEATESVRGGEERREKSLREEKRLVQSSRSRNETD